MWKAYLSITPRKKYLGETILLLVFLEIITLSSAVTGQSRSGIVLRYLPNKERGKEIVLENEEEVMKIDGNSGEVDID